MCLTSALVQQAELLLPVELLSGMDGKLEKISIDVMEKLVDDESFFLIIMEYIARFYQLLGIDDERVIDEDIEGIEHHLSNSTIKAVEDLVAFFQANPDIRAEFENFQSDQSE